MKHVRLRSLLDGLWTLSTSQKQKKTKIKNVGVSFPILEMSTGKELLEDVSSSLVFAVARWFTNGLGSTGWKTGCVSAKIS